MTDEIRLKASYAIKSPASGGEINVDEPIPVVLSDESMDLDGEIVRGFKNLGSFLKNNPVLRWMHVPGTVIGKVLSASVDRTAPNRPTMGQILLAEAGTSELVDSIRSNVRQRNIRAGSVGFRIGSRKALDPDDYRKGFELRDNTLLEFSLVDIGANPNALIAKALAAGEDADACKLASTFVASSRTYVDFGLTNKSRVSDSSSSTPIRRHPKMKLNDQIVQLESELDEQLERLKGLSEAEVADDDVEQHELAVAEVTEEIEATEKALASKRRTAEVLKRNDIERQKRAEETVIAEKSVAEKVAEGESAGSDLDDESRKAMSHSGHLTGAKFEKGELALKTISYMLKAHVARTYPLALLDYERPNRGKAEMEIMLKAATNPADTPTAAWAGNLVQETWDDFVGLLRDISVYAALSPTYVRNLSFDRNGKINIPKNDGRGSLAGGFTAEGAPIPVKEGVIGITDLEPKALKVISAYTNELFRQSIPNIEEVIRDQILGDTAEALDAHLLGAAARTADQPAGYQDPTETGAGNINTATGATVAAITTDLEGMVTRALAARVSTAWTWILSPTNLLKLRNKQDAASGVFSFREELARNQLMGLPWITSQNVSDTEVFLQGNGAVWQASAFAPNFVMSDSVLVFDDTAPDDIVSGGLATTQPTKSMFQTDSTALRMTWGLDYRIVRQGGVQVLNTVAW